MTNPLASKTAARLLADYRKAHPRSRAVSLIKLVKNTGSTKQYGCVLCDAVGPTFSAKWRETKRSIEWRFAHAAEHVAAAEQAIVPGADPEVDTAIECALITLAR